MTASLAERFRRTLAEAVARLDGAPALTPVRTLLTERAALLDQRMRVAVVGRVCQGKSTLVNALIGKSLTPTGTLELSYSVNHIRYGSPPCLTVYFKDHSTAVASVDELEAYAARRDDNRDLLASIDHLDVVSDQPYLTGFDLIDTAGLDSAWIDDSAITLDFLRKSREELEWETVEAAAKADALIVVMSKRGMSATDEEMLRTFLGPESAFRSPVTTIGVLTKVEELWQGGTESPFAAARQIRDLMLKSASVRSVLFDVEPVCSLLAEAALGLDEADLDDLATLADQRFERLLEGSLVSAQVFLLPDLGLPLSPERRSALRDSFTGYGLALATRLIRNDKVDTVAELSEQLEHASGINRVRDRLTDHFAHRADLLKIRLTADLLTRKERSLRRELGSADQRALAGVTSMIAGFQHELGLAELDVLQRIMTEVVLVGDADREEILLLIGEYGRSVHARLGLPPATPMAELATRAEKLHERWVRHGLAIVDRESANVLVERCGTLRRSLREAQSLLEDPR
jgi:hypothetical protein